MEAPQQALCDLIAHVRAEAADEEARHVDDEIDGVNAELLALRTRITQHSRHNFVLERELDELDQKIGLLVRNQDMVQDLITQAAGLTHLREERGNRYLRQRQTQYGRLLYLLQTEPRILAAIASNVSGADIPSFVQTVVFDLFGDQYDSREERLLLTLFEEVLRRSFESATDFGSFGRANTAITQMLSAYARRGQGLGVLRSILAEPLQDIVRSTNVDKLNLDIHPLKAFQSVVQDSETSTGKPWDGPKANTNEEAIEIPQVRALCARRQQQLEEVAQFILGRIVGDVDAIPYGVRWICRSLGRLAKRRFPDASRYQVGSLIGGYIYLRFFNPAIVAPDASNFVKTKPSKAARRNLICVAKVLQNLSNGVEFGKKEAYLAALNPFLRQHQDVLADYFDRLIEVEDDLRDALEFDALLEHTQRRAKSVSLSLGQLFVVHRLLHENRVLLEQLAVETERTPSHVDELDVTIGAGERKSGVSVSSEREGPVHEVLSLLQQLGQVPERVSKKDDYQINLRLHSRRLALFDSAGAKTTTTSGDAQETHASPCSLDQTRRSVILRLEGSQSADEAPLSRSELTMFASQAVRDALLFDQLPDDLVQSAGASMAKLLDDLHARWQNDEEKTREFEAVATLIGALQLLREACEAENLPVESSQNEFVDAFAMRVINAMRRRRQRLAAVRKRLEKIQVVEKQVLRHREYLDGRLSLYRQYLENVKQQGHMKLSATQQERALTKGTGGLKERLRLGRSAPRQQKKYTHSQMEEMGVVCRTDPALRKDLRKCHYVFTMVQPGHFRVEVVYKKVVAIKVLSEPIEIRLEDLLDRQQRGQQRLEYEYVSLNINLLVHLINRKFLRRR